MLSRNSLPSDASAQVPSSAAPAPAAPSPAVHSSEQISPPAPYPGPVIWPSPEPGDPLAEQSGDALDCPPPDPDEYLSPRFGESSIAAPGHGGRPARPARATGPTSYAPPPHGRNGTPWPACPCCHPSTSPGGSRPADVLSNSSPAFAAAAGKHPGSDCLPPPAPSGYASRAAAFLSSLDGPGYAHPPTGFGYAPSHAHSGFPLPPAHFGYTPPPDGPGYAPPASFGYPPPVHSGYNPLPPVHTYVPPAVDLGCVEGPQGGQGSADAHSDSGAGASGRSEAVPRVAASRRPGGGGRHRAAGRARHSARSQSDNGRSPGRNSDEVRQAARRMALFAGAACALYSTGLTLGLTAAPSTSRPLVPLPTVPTASATEDDAGQVDSGEDTVAPDRMAAGSPAAGTSANLPHERYGSASPPALEVSGTIGSRKRSPSPDIQNNRSGSPSPSGGSGTTGPAPSPSGGIPSTSPAPTHAGPTASPTSSGQAGQSAGPAPRGGGKRPTGKGGNGWR
jgi:hypothetical protein